MNKRRLIYIFILVILLIALSIYGKISNPEITLTMCLKEPERYDGTVISVGTEATVAETLPNGFILQQMGRRIPVYGTVPDVAENEFVNILARFHQEGFLELEKIYIAKYRRLKIIASILPVFLVVFLFFKTYRFDFRSYQFFERKTCRT